MEIIMETMQIGKNAKQNFFEFCSTHLIHPHTMKNVRFTSIHNFFVSSFISLYFGSAEIFINMQNLLIFVLFSLTPGFRIYYLCLTVEKCLLLLLKIL